MEYVESKHQWKVGSNRALASTTHPKASIRSQPVAKAANVGLISSACRLPGSLVSNTPVQSIDTVSCIPHNRWDASNVAATIGDTQVAFGSFLADVAGFDAAVFSISETEAVLQDPQQRLLLELSWEALQTTYAAGSLAAPTTFKAGCGVFVGVSSRDYFTLSKVYPQVMSACSRHNACCLLSDSGKQPRVLYLPATVPLHQSLV